VDQNLLGHLITLIIGAITVGVFKNKVMVLEERVKTLEQFGTQYARENINQLKQSVAFHAQEIQEGKARGDQLRDLVTGIFTKVEIIAAWVAEQKEK
jgi:hypothetical protein